MKTANLNPVTARFANALEKRREQYLIRVLRDTATDCGAELSFNGKSFINFASNDYLALSAHPEVKANSIKYIEKYGAGTCSSRLLSGNIEPYGRIEREIAHLKRTESALIFCSGYQANSTVLQTLCGVDTAVLSDKYNHNSIVSTLPALAGRWARYRHASMDHLRSLATQNWFHDCKEKWIISETVFSMDGDIAPVDDLIASATTSGAGLYLDEAHSIGILGEHGFGVIKQADCEQVFMGTFGKAFGGFGSFIACSELVRDYLINFCPGIIYSTALPPAVLGAIEAATAIVPQMDRERARLLETAAELRHRIQALGYCVGPSQTQIIPIVVGAEQDALALARWLEDHHIYAPSIRPPTVPDGTSRVRLSLTLHHTKDMLDQLLESLRKFQPQRSSIL